MTGQLIRTMLVVACLFTGSAPAFARGPAGEVSIQALPREARVTLELIRDGGPFPYSRDGIVFGNRERLLPPRPRGYYHEYTVKTPGERTRGAQRIVCGGDQRTLRDCWYSDDHYQSFKRIR